MKISPELFQAYLKCPTKCWLRAAGEVPSGNAYAEWVKTQDESYRATETTRLVRELPNGDVAISPDSENLKLAKWRLASNVPAQAPVDFCSVQSNIHAVERIPSEGRGRPAQFVPIRFIFRNKLTKDDKLLLAFDAFVLSETLGREVNLGKSIHGDVRSCARESAAISQAPTTEVPSKPTSAAFSRTQLQPQVLKVKTLALAAEVPKLLDKIAALLASEKPPDLVLNRHCPECEFRDRCRQKAIETDDLSLLAGMSAKERQKLRSKGIFTVTQLSYTFRPRRRPKRLRDKREKYHHSLKALAIREKKIHIVGSPDLKIEGTPVYLDVEGLPDRDFYYLIGLRIGHGDSAVQHSLWADTVADEGKIWREFLAILETVEKPVLIHYGSYETEFLKQMRQRHGEAPSESGMTKAVQSGVNLLSHIYAQIYFSGNSNGLKDTADTLGFKWSEAGASGLTTIAWRNQWERSCQPELKASLLAYNAQDCEAVSLVAKTVGQLSARVEGGIEAPALSVVRADADDFAKRAKWRKFTSSVEGFERMNATAHWDYHRHRIYARSSTAAKKAVPPTPRKLRPKRVQLVVVCPASPKCPRCEQTGRWGHARTSRTVNDIIFGRHSLKLRLVEYRFRVYRCRKCQIKFGVDNRCQLFRRYGWNLVAYLLYQIVELGIPQLTVLHGFNRLLSFDLSQNGLHHMKASVASYYAQTKATILERLVRGNLVHADETRANIRGKVGFVWVLTSHNEVVYLLADSREGEIAQEVLAGFKGVLVSDFYTGYDSIGCPQQRCLIHLMRDLNDEVLTNPFDDQLKQLVTEFGGLLQLIVQTVDRYGLKRRFLRRHLADADHFFAKIGKAEYQSEAAMKCKERFERNRDKLFTFLNYDGVPWHNNNAEHAIKAFARLRDVVGGASTEKGLEEYLTLLSVCQTCKYMGVDFLDFLRSGEKDIHAFAESRRRRRKLSVHCESADSVSGTPSSESRTEGRSCVRENAADFSLGGT